MGAWRSRDTRQPELPTLKLLASRSCHYYRSCFLASTARTVSI